MLNEPTMSDQTLLLSVEDLINMAMGPVKGNTVDFKLVKTILHILARQMRMLEQKVILEVEELPAEASLLAPSKRFQSTSSVSKGKGKGKATGHVSRKDDGRPGKRYESDTRYGKRYESVSEESEDSDAREEREEEAQRAKDKERKMRVKAEIDKERAEMERAKMKKMNPEEQEQFQKELEKERRQREEAEKLAEEEEARAEKEARAKREKARAESKKEKAEKERLRIEKEKEREEQEKAKMEKMNENERKQYEKELEQEKIKRAKAQKEEERIEKEKARLQREKEKEKERVDREKAKIEKMSPREREKYEKELKKDDSEREEERKRLKTMSPKEREQYEKNQFKENERAKLEKMSPKEREQYEKEKQKEKAEKEKAKMEKMSPQEREQYEKEHLKKIEGADAEKAKLEKMSPKEREKYETEQQKEKEKAEKQAQKQLEIEKEKLEKMSPKEREQYEKEKQKEKAEEVKAKSEKMSPQEKEQYEKEQLKKKERADAEKAKLEKMSPKEREKYEKQQQKEEAEREKAKIDKTSPKEKEQYEKEQRKEKEKAEKEREKMEKMSPKEREQYEKEKQKEKAEKEKAKMEKMSPQEREQYEKEQQKKKERADAEKAKLEKMSPKEREKYEKEQQKEKEKGEKQAQKELEIEKEKIKKMSPIEREKYEKEQQKEKEKLEIEREKLKKMSPKVEKYDKEQQKEKEKAEKQAQTDLEIEKEKLEKMSPQERKRYEQEKERKSSETGETISERYDPTLKEKVLVVEKGPSKRGGELGRRRSSTELVTRSQFALLESAVEALKQQTGPLPALKLPGNEQLRSDLAEGNLTLPDAMTAMQVSARVEAAEQAIGRLGGVLTQLAAIGAIPEVEGLRDEVEGFGARPVTPTKGPSKPATAAQKVQMKEPSLRAPGAGLGTLTSTVLPSQSISTAQPYASSKIAMILTQHDMDGALEALRNDLMEKVTAITARALSAVETTNNLVQSVVENMDVALNLNGRISTLHSLVTDYSDQLAGFDAGLTTQMQSFREQITLMRGDLTAGLKLLESANNNAETAAMMELTERYEELVVGLDTTQLAHQNLCIAQDQLNLDFRSLLESVEMLREQKADRDEVTDGLRDKADISRLTGLLHTDEFNEAHAGLGQRLLACHDKFRKQDALWMDAIKDLTEELHRKADYSDLMKTRDEATQQLREIDEKIKCLAYILGDPKAAIITRELAKGMLCAACMVPAQMEPQDIMSDKPPRLPEALPRPAPVIPEEPCLAEFKLPDLRPHACRRWAGGSHTLLTAATRGPRQPPHPPGPVRRFLGQGDDGRLYMMETEMQPCEECNIPPHCSEGGPCKWPF